MRVRNPPFVTARQQPRKAMSKRLEGNKDLVQEAFETLFNKRDYAAAERFWSPGYVQHSAHIEPGREGLFHLVKGLPPTLKYEPGVIVADRFRHRAWPILRFRPR